MLVPVRLTDKRSGKDRAGGVSLVFLLTGNDSQVPNETNEVYTII